MAKKYPDIGGKRYRRELKKGYREGGLTNTKDKSSPHYKNLDRDVTKRGMDPFSEKAYRPNKAIRKRVGFSENFDDQDRAIRKDYQNVRKAKVSKEIDKLAGKKDAPAKAVSSSFGSGARAKSAKRKKNGNRKRVSTK